MSRAWPGPLAAPGYPDAGMKRPAVLCTAGPGRAL